MAEVNYRGTFRACCAGFFTQAIVVNLTPVLFIPLREQFGFTFTQLGMLVLVNFLTQLLADLGCSAIADRIGFRFFAVAGHICAVLGLTFFALVPFLPVAAYPGFVVGTVLFSLGGGFLEVIISPIVNALPAREKTASMSLVHAFYCWGQVSVVLVTTFFIFIFGRTSWHIIMLIWMAVPLVNGMLFLRCPLAPHIPDEKRSSVVSVLKNPVFAVLVLLIVFSGASELTLSQWTSAYAEDVLNVPKVVGDMAGMCMFAVMMGVARTVNGVKGKMEYLRKLMLAGGVLALVCYVTVAVTPSPAVGLAACALCGLGVSLLWPGTISLSVKAFPMAGIWMMAILAAGGDTGASVGPFLTGWMADHIGLRMGMLVSAVFPLGVVVCLLTLRFLEGRRPVEGRE
jgi:fucose permease